MLLLESLLVSLLAAVIAIGVALWGGTVLRQQLLPRVHWVGAAVDGRVLGFTAALALITGVLAGLVPAMRSSRPDLAAALKGGARDGGLQRSKLRPALLVTQSALSVVLLAGAGLFVRSLHSVQTENIGYDADRVVFAEVNADPDHTARESEMSNRLPELAARIATVRGVEATGMSRLTPMRGLSWTRAFLASGDSLPRIGGESPLTSWVSPGFFRTMGMRVLSGRGFTPQDRLDDALAMVVSETMAHNYWPGRSPLGECVRVGARDSRCVPIVGVVSDVHTEGIVQKPAMQFYLPLADTGSRRAGVIAIRVAPGYGPSVAARIRRQLRAEFADWAEVNVHTMTDDLAPELGPWRIGAAVFTAAGLLALLVAIVTPWLMISYSFGSTHRTKSACAGRARREGG